MHLLIKKLNVYIFTHVPVKTLPRINYITWLSPVGSAFSKICFFHQQKRGGKGRESALKDQSEKLKMTWNRILNYIYIYI